MRTVPKNELRRHTARVLATVDADGEVVVTERGVPKWRIRPIDESHRVDDLPAEQRRDR